MQRKRIKNTLSILPIVIIILGGVLMITGAFLLFRNRGANQVAPLATATSQFIGGEPSYPEIERVNLEDAKKAYDDGTAVFLDVRGASVYADSHIAGAINIPFSELVDRAGELDKNQWIITYCT